VYPQGCDVCNHLSLFLCVADYDKLLPGAPGRPALGAYSCAVAVPGGSGSSCVTRRSRQRIRLRLQLSSRMVQLQQRFMATQIE
jgi:hypothetical protein